MATKFYVSGNGWSGCFSVHEGADHPFHLNWCLPFEDRPKIEFIAFRTAIKMEEYMDKLDIEHRDFPDFEHFKNAAADEMIEDVRKIDKDKTHGD